MIDLYTWPTPNGHKIHIMLEEIGLQYNIHPINIGKGEQFSKDFLKISPNNKMPVIVDQNGPSNLPYAVFESGAILMYLAEKSNCLLSNKLESRFDTIQWLMFQMSNIGPMFGQTHHFRSYAPTKIPYAIDRYTNEAGRLYNILNNRLKRSTYLAGLEYSIADIATFPWVRSIERQGYHLDEFPAIKRWFTSIESRPAVQRGCAVLAEVRRDSKTPITKEERKNLFGSPQFRKR